MSGNLTKAHFIGLDEEAYIDFELLNPDLTLVKAALQRLCGRIESGGRLVGGVSVRQRIIFHLSSMDILVRRWSYKAIALTGMPANTPIETIVEKIRTENDFENSCWLMAAIFHLTHGDDIKKVCSNAGVQFDINYELAARVFSNAQWLQDHAVSRRLDIDREDPITLKWASLLTGYGKASENLFHPRLENKALLQQLNSHDQAQVSEYSVWALWKFPAYSRYDLGIPAQSIVNQPASVKRWVNRLLTKDPTWIPSEADLFQSLTTDPDFSAREGLAIGLVGAPVANLENLIIPWYTFEPTERIKNIIMEYMAIVSDGCAEYFDLIVQRFRSASREDGLRRRLLSAATGRNLYNELKRIMLIEQAGDVTLPLFGSPTNMEIVMGNKTSIGSIGSIQAANVTFGDMVNSANTHISNLNQSSPLDADAFKKILYATQVDEALSQEQKLKIASAVNDAAKSPTQENKSLLKKLIEGAKDLTTLAQAGEGVWHEIHNLIDLWPL